MDAKYLIPPKSVRPKGSFRVSSISSLFDALHTNFSLSTLLLIGATLQTLLLVLPIRRIYTVTPALTLLLIRAINTALVTYGYIPNPYLQSAIPKKSTAHLPDRNGNFGAPGSEKIAILLLGAKSNHPLGIFAPDFATTGKFIQRMTDELEGDSTQESGFLGQTGFVRKDANGANENIFISYWRSLDDVHRFAHAPTHREAWKWWDATLKEHNHIGFMHEIFEADRGMWESVYINFQPTLLGATTFLKRDGKIVGGEVKEEWVSPLLDANKGILRSSNGRRGERDRKERVGDMFEENAYAAEF